MQCLLCRFLLEGLHLFQLWLRQLRQLQSQPPRRPLSQRSNQLHLLRQWHRRLRLPLLRLRRHLLQRLHRLNQQHLQNQRRQQHRVSQWLTQLSAPAETTQPHLHRLTQPVRLKQLLLPLTPP